MNLHHTHLLILGGGELGRELAISATRMGLQVSVAARYAGAPATQVTPRAYILEMLDTDALTHLIQTIQPNLIMTEIEAISMDAIRIAEQQHINVIPSASAIATCMHRETLRMLAKKLNIPTSACTFASTEDELIDIAKNAQKDLYIKPLQSSSGHGQTRLTCGATSEQARQAWQAAMLQARAKHGQRVIVEEHVDILQEITLLCAATPDTIFFCDPIGHTQEDGDYRLSWQPCEEISHTQLKQMHDIARTIIRELGGSGLFGAEFFITQSHEVLFSEISPRPHDTGMVTLITQDLNEFDLHILTALNALHSTPTLLTPGASAALISDAHSENPEYKINSNTYKNTQIHIFQKPVAHPGRRMGVALAHAKDTKSALHLVKCAQQEFDVS